MKILILTSFITVSVSQAATSLIDFSASTSAPATAAGGNFWTTVGTSATTNLLDSSSGVDSGWDLSVSLSDATVGFGGNGINGNGDAAPFDQSFAIIDGIFSNKITGIATLSFSGLAASTQYDFSTYSDRAGGYANGVIESTATGTGPASTALLKDTVTNFSFTSDASGALTFTFREGPTESATVGDNAVLNALSMTAVPVPEPSSSALLGLGGLALILRRKK